MPAEWAVVEADSLVASHDPVSFAPRKDYPISVQERPYDRDREEQNKVEAIARDMKPAMVVNTNPDAINGAPIVTEQGVVLGGNGRTMGMQRAYKRYGESGKALKDHLMSHARAFGLSSAQVKAMSKPVLVRRVKAAGTEKMTRLGRRMNEALTQGLDVRSAEVALSKFVTSDVVDVLTHHMGADQTLSAFLHTPASKPFVEAIERAGIIDDRNKNQFMSGGLLNEDGRQRVSRVMAARLVPDAALLDSMNQTWRENLAQSVPYFLQAETSGWDLRPHLEAAVKADADMQAKGFDRTAKDRKLYLSQLELQDPSKRAPEARLLLEVLHTKGGQKRGLPKAFKQVALEAERQRFDHGEQGSMFARPKKTAEQAMRESFGIEDRKAASMDWSMTLLKAGQVGAEGLSRYVMHAVNWELANQMRGAMLSAKPGDKIDGEKILAKLRAFIVDQAHQDKDFARGMGVNPLDTKVLRGLLETHAKSRVSELAKSLAKASLWSCYAG
jgi:hypothetical protein